MENQLLKDFEFFKAETKKDLGIDVTLADFKRIRAEEARAAKVQKEAEFLAGAASDVEESNAKCFSCSAGLSIVEVMLYGNRCVFCVENKIDIGPVYFLLKCYYDRRIYQALLRSDCRTDLLGCLGFFGYRDINQVKTVKQKRELLKELRGFKR